MLTLIPILSRINPHYRDKNITLDSRNHKYTIIGHDTTDYYSVTTWVKNQFEPFDQDEVIEQLRGKPYFSNTKYSNLTNEGIKDMWNRESTLASKTGTYLHDQIECLMNNTILTYPYNNGKIYEVYKSYILEHNITLDYLNETCKDWSYVLRFIMDNPTMQPYRTEWCIYHEEYKLMGCLDILYTTTDNYGNVEYILCDWKRCKDISKTSKYDKMCLNSKLDDIPDAGFWRYSIQLNLYAIILRDKYDIDVSQMFIINFHPNGSNYDVVTVSDMKEKIIAALIG